MFKVRAGGTGGGSGGSEFSFASCYFGVDTFSNSVSVIGGLVQKLFSCRLSDPKIHYRVLLVNCS